MPKENYLSNLKRYLFDFLIARGAYCSLTRRTWQGTRRKELFPVGKRQSEHILGNYEKTIWGEKSRIAKQGTRDGRGGRTPSSRN